MVHDVLFVHNKRSPYREYLFSQMSEEDWIDLTVYYCNQDTQRDWETGKYTNYDYEKLKYSDLFSISDISFNPLIIQEIIKQNPDSVVCSWSGHGTTLFALLVSALSNTNFVYWSAQTKDSSPSNFPMIKQTKQLVLRLADSIIVPGLESKKYHESLGADRSKIFISSNVVNNQKFYTASDPSLEIKEEIKGKTTILYVGRLMEKKGILDLVKSFKDLKKENPDVALVVIGDGELKEELITMTDDTSDIFFTGYIQDREELSQYYSLVDIFTLPSHEDTWGLVINEAMASGLPVVSSTSTGAHADMIQHGENGFVIEPGNITELSNALTKLIENSQLRNRMGNNSRTIMKRQFEVDHAIKGFKEALCENCK